MNKRHMTSSGRWLLAFIAGIGCARVASEREIANELFEKRREELRQSVSRLAAIEKTASIQVKQTGVSLPKVYDPPVVIDSRNPNWNFAVVGLEDLQSMAQVLNSQKEGNAYTKFHLGVSNEVDSLILLAANLAVGDVLAAHNVGNFKEALRRLPQIRYLAVAVMSEQIPDVNLSKGSFNESGWAFVILDLFDIETKKYLGRISVEAKNSQAVSYDSNENARNAIASDLKRNLRTNLDEEILRVFSPSSLKTRESGDSKS